MTHSTQCGFAGVSAFISGVMTRGFSLGDPAGGHGALQEEKSPSGSPKISLISGKKGKGSRDP